MSPRIIVKYFIPFWNERINTAVGILETKKNYIFHTLTDRNDALLLGIIIDTG